ncbi:MAG: peptidyl-prolyl cis-trans isomerase [Flavicella sp.]|nr:peptidyl-prolyl cis-trans isomerase [Flavicella sp.]
MFPFKEKKKDSKLIAKVYNHKLYQEDLELVFPKDVASKDSAEVANNLILSWARKKLLLQKAEVNMPSQNEELEVLVERYREDLFINSFKKALVVKELDTVVSHEDLEKYYEENKESFKINEELVKFRYIALKPTDRNRAKYKRLLLSKSMNDLFILDEQTDKMESAFLSDSLWFRYKDVQRKLPVLKKYSKAYVLKPNKFIAKSHEGDLYYVYIKDVVNRNEIAPLRYISKTIEQMVVQQRKLQMIHKVEEVLVDDAMKNKQFEIY